MDEVATEGNVTAVQRDKLCELFDRHTLCLLFEDIAVALKEAMDAGPDLVAKMLDASSLPPLLKAVAKVLMRKAAEIAIKGLTTQVELLRINACALALVFCPDPAGHRSHQGDLDTNCARPFYEAVTEPADNAV